MYMNVACNYVEITRDRPLHSNAIVILLLVCLPLGLRVMIHKVYPAEYRASCRNVSLRLSCLSYPRTSFCGAIYTSHYQTKEENRICDGLFSILGTINSLYLNRVTWTYSSCHE